MSIDLLDGMTVREVIAYVFTGCVTLITTILLLRRRVSRDSVEIFKDRREVNVAAAQDVEIRTLRESNAALSREHNEVMRELGRLTGLLSMMPDMYRTQLNMASAIDNNTKLTEKAADRADAAFKEANTVNTKIEAIGLQMADGSKASAQDAK